MTTKPLSNDEQAAYDHVIKTLALKAKSNYRLRRLPREAVRQSTQDNFDGALALAHLDSVSFSLFEKIIVRSKRQYDTSYKQQQRKFIY